jgi:hypothetical protein
MNSLTDTISDQTGILATDVTAPVTVLPDTTEVTQPTDTTTPTTTNEGVTPPVVTEDSTTLGITPGFGNIEAAPLGTLSDGVAAGEQGGKGAGEDTGVLPESISMQTATDVQTPTDLASGNPDGVTPPDTDGLPPLGTTPSDNPTEVQLPADLSTSPLPPVETGVQVLEVSPPEGWRPVDDGGVETLDFWSDLAKWWEQHLKDARNLANEEIKQRVEVAHQTGDNNAVPAVMAEEIVKGYIIQNLDKLGDGAVNDLSNIINNVNSKLNPTAQLEFYRQLGTQMYDLQSGMKNENDVDIWITGVNNLLADLSNSSQAAKQQSSDDGWTNLWSSSQEKLTIPFIHEREMRSLAANYGYGIMLGIPNEEINSCNVFAAYVENAINSSSSPREAMDDVAKNFANFGNTWSGGWAKPQNAPIRLGDSSGFRDEFKDDVGTGGGNGDQAHHVVGAMKAGFFEGSLGIGDGTGTMNTWESIAGLRNIFGKEDGISNADLQINSVAGPIGANLQGYTTQNFSLFGGATYGYSVPQAEAAKFIGGQLRSGLCQ